MSTTHDKLGPQLKAMLDAHDRTATYREHCEKAGKVLPMVSEGTDFGLADIALAIAGLAHATLANADAVHRTTELGRA